MKSRVRSLSCILATLVFATMAFAATREVGPGQSYATIQSCLNAAQPGDTCNVHASTYTEQLTMPNGTAGNVITLRANPGDTVTVQSSNTPVINVASRSYFAIDGLNVTFTGTANPAAAISGNDSAAHHFTISNNHLTMNGGGCPDRGALALTYAHDFNVTGNTIYVNSPSPCDGGDYLNVYNVQFIGNKIYGNANGTTGKLEDGLVFGGYNIKIENNTLHDGWSYNTHPDGIVIQGWWPAGAGTSHDVKVVGNTVYNFTQGIYVDAISSIETNILIANNLVYESGYQYPTGKFNVMNCMTLDGENIAGANFPISVNVFNNVMDCRQLGIYMLRTTAGGTVNIKNNILVNPPYGAMNMSSSLGAVMDYNFYSGGDSRPIFWGGTAYTVSGFSSIGEAHGKSGTANLNSDYTEKPTSPTIGEGINLSTYFTTDRAGSTRTVPWDMGAYQSGSSATAPSAPTSLTATVQ